MNRYAWIVWLGGGFLGYVAAEMALDDAIVRKTLGALVVILHRFVPIVTGVAIAAFGWRWSSQKRDRVPEPL